MSRFRPVTARAARRLAAMLLCASAATASLAAPEIVAPQAVAPQLPDGAAAPLDDKPVADLAAPPSAAPDSAFVDRMRDKASTMVLTAMNFLGVPYRRGGDSVEHGFDCSGFTRHIFETSLGLVLPRRADEQAKTAGLLRIGRNDLRPGDLVFFNTMRRTFSHVGIYLGEGRFIHSPKPGGEVRVDDMRTAYWDTRFTGARRAEAAAVRFGPSNPVE